MPATRSRVPGGDSTGAHTDLLVFNASCAYPAAWGARLRGAALGLLAIVLLNVVRIGNLSLVAADKDLFYLLHIYVWPGILILATACYVFAWMNRAGRAAPAGGGGMGAIVRSRCTPSRRPWWR